MKNEIGVIVGLRDGRPDFDWVESLGLRVCQIFCGQPLRWAPDLAECIREESKKRGIRVTGVFAGCPRGEPSGSLVPPAWVSNFKQAGEMAKRAGVPAVLVEFGFLPGNRSDPRFEEVAAAFREVAQHLEGLGVEFWFETTQEAPIALLRLMRAIGTDNLGVNLDPGNLTIYGAGNPLDAVEIYGTQVRNLHAKDGFLPTDPIELGVQAPVGKGSVDFPALLRRLNQLGFAGEIIIEREVEDPEQKRRDILDTVVYLRDLMKTI